MIDRALASDLRLLDDLLMAELIARPATPPGAAEQLGALTAAHRDGVEHADGGADALALPAASSPVLAAIERRFGLLAIDRLLLVLALAVELDGRYAHVFAALNDVAGLARPTVALAQQLARRRAGVAVSVVERLLPSRPLGRYALVTADGAPGAVHRCLALPGDVLEWFADGAETRAPAGERIDELAIGEDAAERLRVAARWIGLQPKWTLWIHGPPGSGRAAAARAIVGASGRRCLSVDAGALAERGTAALLRAAAWADAVLLVEDAEAGDLAALRALAAPPAPLAVTSRTGALTPLLAEPHPCLDLALQPLSSALRAGIWRRHLEGVEARVELDAVAERYRMGPARVAMAARRAIDASRGAGRAVDRAAIDRACGDLVTGRLGDLAARLEVAGAGAALVLAAGPARELDLAVAWARHGRAAMARSGPGLVATPGDHVVCLFHGPPGTGKTLGARALAERLGLDAFRVDLSQLVSKWVGETEKNLARLFDEAETANAVLFFDEADALFSRRTEVRDAHDKYANVEAGYLLQRIEEHRGVVILATNFMRNLDNALVRRCQILVEFAQPGVEQRREIWRRCLGREAEALDLDLVAARFELSGGDIRNAAVAALLLATMREGALVMEDLVVGTWRELSKAGRIKTPEEFGPWRDVVLAYAQATRSG
jgi:AAA+ superfamily predicted ATPase